MGVADRTSKRSRWQVPEHALSYYFGMTGLTACFGMNEILAPKTGKVCYVSGGAGAVGATVSSP